MIHDQGVFFHSPSSQPLWESSPKLGSSNAHLALYVSREGFLATRSHLNQANYIEWMLFGLACCENVECGQLLPPVFFLTKVESCAHIIQCILNSKDGIQLVDFKKSHHQAGASCRKNQNSDVPKRLRKKLWFK